MNTEMELLQGTVCAVVFQNEENGYTVLKLDCESGEVATVVGTIPMVTVGERLLITGRWTNHASYGRQFSAEFLERMMPESKGEILAFLSSRMIKGVGAKTAARIVERFGERSLEVIEHEPELLAQLPGITPAKAEKISKSLQQQVGVRRLIEFLTSHGLPAQLAIRLFRTFGEYAIDEVQENPYLLTEEEFGGSFAQVDVFALSIGMEADDERRVEAGVLFELSHNLGNGHVFLPQDKLVAATATLLSLEPQCILDAMTRLQEQQRVQLDEIAGLQVCYLPAYYEAETEIAARLTAMARARLSAPKNLESLIERIEARSELQYAPEQRTAIAAAANHQALIVTGGPGTGKTTTLGGILQLLGELQLSCMLAAPTGRAAKRLAELTGRPATTIHRLLEAQISPDTGAMMFFHNASEPLKTDAVIVDETSMVDLLLMQSLLEALPERCRLILVGDPDQLPSVGAGNVFSDLIRSGVVHTVRLQEIFRQARQSLIVMNAHAVNQGQLPDLQTKNRDFFFMRRLSGERVVQTIQELCARRLPDNMGIASGDIQVLSPTRKGVAGTANLNRELQAVLNPQQAGKKEKICGDFCFREGDRVMQIRNNYDIMWKKVGGTEVGTGIFNGDIGVITEINHPEETVTIVFDDRQASYDFTMLPELEPAYAMTVHKSQGSEYRAVILAAHQGSQLLLTRSILYTAITRARELFIIVGNEEVIAAMTHNDRQQRRYSGLKLRLQAAGKD